MTHHTYVCAYNQIKQTHYSGLTASIVDAFRLVTNNNYVHTYNVNELTGVKGIHTYKHVNVKLLCSILISRYIRAHMYVQINRNADTIALISDDSMTQIRSQLFLLFVCTNLCKNYKTNTHCGMVVVVENQCLSDFDETLSTPSRQRLLNETSFHLWKTQRREYAPLKFPPWSVQSALTGRKT